MLRHLNCYLNCSRLWNSISEEQRRDHLQGNYIWTGKCLLFQYGNWSARNDSQIQGLSLNLSFGSIYLNCYFMTKRKSVCVVHFIPVLSRLHQLVLIQQSILIMPPLYVLSDNCFNYIQSIEEAFSLFFPHPLLWCVPQRQYTDTSVFLSRTEAFFIFV